MIEKRKFHGIEIAMLRIAAGLLLAAYFLEWLDLLISSGDLRLTTIALGLALTILCNFGLLFATLSTARERKYLAMFALLPTFLLSPIIVATYHYALSILVLLIGGIATKNLFHRVTL